MTPTSNTAWELRPELRSWPLAPEVLEGLPSPSLVIWMVHVRHNVERLLAVAEGRWRPHIKTVKIPEVLSIPIALGVRTFKCATTREARVMATLLEERAPGQGDLCVAFPHVGPNLARLGELARALPGVRWSMISEDPSHAASVPEGLGIFVDVNSGMDRTGAPVEDLERVVATAKAAGSRLRGVHAYDGHNTESDPAQRTIAVRASNRRVRDVVDRLRREGLAVAEVITAGTPACLDALEDEGWAGRDEVHRVSPGTVVLGDLRCLEQVPRLELRAAALVMARVISRPRPGRVTCDAGSKALSADVELVGRPIGWDGLEPQRPSEEHLPLDVVSGDAPRAGQPLFFVPGHVCPTVNLHEGALLVQPDGRTERVRITARGHE